MRELLRRAAQRFESAPPAGLVEELEEVREVNAHWLGDYALFAALKEHHDGAPWYEWPADLALRRSGALTVWRGENSEKLAAVELGQFLFFRQWRARRDLVVYTGTHDNNATVGWWQDDLSEAERTFVLRYTGADGREIHWDLIRLALSSVADLAALPHQDLAGLGSDCRMNTPGVVEGNWRFRLTGWMLYRAIQERLAGLVEVYGRTSGPAA